MSETPEEATLRTGILHEGQGYWPCYINSDGSCSWMPTIKAVPVAENLVHDAGGYF